jgi:hypothetical protein
MYNINMNININMDISINVYLIQSRSDMCIQSVRDVQHINSNTHSSTLEVFVNVARDHNIYYLVVHHVQEATYQHK